MKSKKKRKPVEDQGTKIQRGSSPPNESQEISCKHLGPRTCLRIIFHFWQHYNGQWMPPDARLICPSIQIPLLVPSLWMRHSATMATAARLSEVCIEMRSRKWKEASRKTLANTRFSLPDSANIPTWCGSLCPPSVGGQTRAGVAHLHAHTHTLRAVLSHRGRCTDFSWLYFCGRQLQGAHRIS